VSPALARSVGPPGKNTPFNRLSLPCSFSLRTISSVWTAPCPEPTTIAPPSRSTSSAKPRPVQVGPGVTVVGVQVGQTEPGSVCSVLATKYLLKFRARYVLLTGLGAGPMAPMRAWMFASIELSTGGIGKAGG
jgi:hypothetical protein